MWSIDVVASPFHHKDQSKMFRTIKQVALTSQGVASAQAKVS